MAAQRPLSHISGQGLKPCSAPGRERNNWPGKLRLFRPPAGTAGRHGRTLGFSPFRVEWCPGPQAEPFGRPTPNPAPRAGKSSPPDGLGSWPRQAATSPKPLSVLAFLTLSRVRFAGLRPPLTAPSTRATMRLGVGLHRRRQKAAGGRFHRNDIEPYPWQYFSEPAAQARRTMKNPAEAGSACQNGRTYAALRRLKPSPATPSPRRASVVGSGAAGATCWSTLKPATCMPT